MIFDVTAYGATGDGVTDDRAAMQAALNAAGSAGGGQILIPADRYVVSGPLSIRPPGNVRITAYGATVINKPGGNVLQNFNYGTDNFPGYSGPSNIVVEGGTWDGGGTSNSSINSNVIIFSHCTDITFRDMKVMHAVWGHGIEVNATTRALAQNCSILGFWYKVNSRQMSEAIQIDFAFSGSGACLPFDNTPCRDITIDGCTVDKSSTAGSFGKIVGSHTQNNSIWHDGIRVANCKGQNLMHYGIYGVNWRNVAITGNIIRNSNAGITVASWATDPYGATTSVAQGLTVTGNVCDLMGLTNGNTDDGVLESAIRFNGGTADDSPIRDVVVSGNVLNRYYNKYGIRGYWFRDAVVNSNIVTHGYASGSTGIYLSTGSGAVINGNLITGVSSGTAYYNVSDYIDTDNR